MNLSWLFVFRTNTSSVNQTETMPDARRKINFEELRMFYMSIQTKHVDAKKKRYRFNPNAETS